MDETNHDRAEHLRNMNAGFGWIAAGAVLVVALLFMFTTPTARVASDGNSTTAGQSTTGQGSR
jgi:hypothetical protein